MAAHKTLNTKRRLAKAMKGNRPMPRFIREKTGARHVRNPLTRHWRRRCLDI